MTTKGGTYGFIILAGTGLHHPRIMCSCGNQAYSERPDRAKPAMADWRDHRLGNCEYPACAVVVWKTLRWTKGDWVDVFYDCKKEI